MPVFRPTLDLKIELGEMRWAVRALVDTGAPVTLLDRGAGDALAVDFDKEPRRMELHHVGGHERWAQVERITMKLDAFPDLSWEADVGFLVEDWNMSFGALLGAQGFLDRWVVSFNVKEDYFVVEEPASFESRLPVDVTEEFERRDQGFRGP